MKKNNINLIRFTFLLFIFSCASTVDPLKESLTPAEYFQKAYEAADKNNYSLAIKYYQAFMEKFPEETERNLWAEYEIAFTYYKMGKDQTAIELFDKLIARYDEEKTLPIAPKALAEKVKEKILTKKK